jgi:hypothetical protein
LVLFVSPLNLPSLEDIGRAVAWLVLVSLATYSVLVWIGRPAFIRRALPGWIDDDGLLGLQARAITISSIWLSAGLFLLFGALFVEGMLAIRPSDKFVLNPIDVVLLVPGVAMLILWYASAGWMRPRWSLPAWFRKDLHRGRYAPAHRTPPPPGPGLWPHAWRARIPHVVLLAALVIGGSMWAGDAECRRARGDVEGCQSMIPSAWTAGAGAGLITTAVGLPLGWFTTQSGAKGERLRRRNLRLASISSTVAWIILGAGGVLSFLRGGFAIALTALLAWLGVVMLVVAIDWVRRALRDRDIATLH